MTGLFVVILPDVASAATDSPVPGSQVWVAQPPGRTLTAFCSTAACLSGAPLTRGTVDCGAANCGPEWDYRVVRTDKDPRTFPFDGTFYDSPHLGEGGTQSPPGTLSGSVFTYSNLSALTQGRYLAVVAEQSTGDVITNVWDMGAASGGPVSPAPTTTAAPTSSAGSTASATATTTPATSSAPATTTDPAPTSSPAADGSPSVVTLDDSQWGDVLLALGCLVFFSAASFVASLRRGR